MAACPVCGAAGTALLCRACTREVETALGDMPALLLELDVQITRQSRVYRRSRARADDADAEAWAAEQRAVEPRLRSRSPVPAIAPSALPIDITAADLRRDVVDELMRVACLVGADVVHSRTVIQWLIRHIPDLRKHPDAAELWDRLTHLRKRVERAVDRSASPVFAGPCHAETTEPVTSERDGTLYVEMITHRCSRDLYASSAAVFATDTDTEITIVCDGTRGDGRGCGAVHTAADRHQWLQRSVTEAVLPLDMLTRALPRLFPHLTFPLNRSTWSRWLSSGRLAARAVDRAGVELYSGADVLELVDSAQNAITANAAKHRRTA